MQPLSGWLDQYSIEESLEIYRELALEHLRLVDVPKAAILRDLLQRRDWASVLKVELDYGEGYSIWSYIQIRQALGFFQKLNDLDIGIDRTLVARDKFYKTEFHCAITNDLFAARIRGGLSFLPHIEDALRRARERIARLLGPAPKISELRMKHGPGASTNVKRKDAAAVEKFARGIQCSPNLHASGLLPVILRQVPHWTAAHATSYYVDEDGWLCESLPVSICYGKLGFVPKNATTYRTTVTEPPLNMFVQLGIGDVIAERLRSVGIDTRDQSANRAFAREGSLTGRIATLDLVSASDMIARQLVRFLLPDDWFFLLDSTRSATIIDRWLKTGVKTLDLQKFSSMGNGFTFPLETLIFWALTSSVSADPKRVSCYGDDIICPTENVGDVIAILEHCGFSVNTKKSFSTGLFRESCGADYINGIDIRPYYAKHRVSAASLFVLHNFYVKENNFDMADAVREKIHPELAIFGPPGYGDGHLHYPAIMNGEWVLDSLTPKRFNAAKGWGGFRFDTFTKTPVAKRTKYPGDWITPLYATYIRGDAAEDWSQDETSQQLCQVFGDEGPLEVQRVLFSSTKHDGRPIWTYPGSEGYSRVSIYTLGF